VVILNPDALTRRRYEARGHNLEAMEERIAAEYCNLPAVTTDGRAIGIEANIEFPAEVPGIFPHGAEGVGLFRTEFLFINRDKLPTEEEQYQVYRQVTETLKPQPVIIRTLDLGGDKFSSQLQLAEEMNPFLGWRAIRFCLAQPEVFRAQLRAILRASAAGNVKMMYPMISGLDELTQANAHVEKCKEELRAEKVPFDEKMEIGAMIEIPSAALVADALAKRVNFFSIGTNDLIQYTLAIDRNNENVADMYNPQHPAVLHLIHNAIQTCRAYDVECSICGQAGSDPKMAVWLVEHGITSISANIDAIAKIREAVARTEKRIILEAARTKDAE